MSSSTPTYDRLREKLDAKLASDRAIGRGLHPVTVGLMKGLSKAITSGQRAGDRAVRNVFAPYEYEPFGSYDHSEVMGRAQAAASAASAAARERAAVKLAQAGF